MRATAGAEGLPSTTTWPSRRNTCGVLGFERVLIVNWDYHHGNGTEHLLPDGSVLLFSTFDADAYPRSGTAARISAGATRPRFNHPLPAGASDDDVLAVYERSLVPAATRFDPDFVLVSAGFDSARGRHVGAFQLQRRGLPPHDADRGRRRRTRRCSRRLVSLLEGDYDLSDLASAAHAHVWALSRAALALPEPRRSAPPRDMVEDSRYAV